MHYAAIRLSPGECSAPYDAGWRYAEWFLGKGGDVIADPSCNWSDEKANGWRSSGGLVMLAPLPARAILSIRPVLSDGLTSRNSPGRWRWI
jgi:hypothetical protein